MVVRALGDYFRAITLAFSFRGAEEADWGAIDVSLARMSHVYSVEPETTRTISRLDITNNIQLK
jgi:hypothetical protein